MKDLKKYYGYFEKDVLVTTDDGIFTGAVVDIRTAANNPEDNVDAFIIRVEYDDVYIPCTDIKKIELVK
ncbi:hypothetical protein [Enterococcus dispar]|uniref:hypothetical protein n=1 Tax=Enterococcus TaxID=1350 RepID=UPI00232EE596|nr:hypothetical protein [Enterococcus dispar]WCG33984.1 hypothetical protein PML78_04635 [Enterococcus dispar]